MYVRGVCVVCVCTGRVEGTGVCVGVVEGACALRERVDLCSSPWGR